VLPGVARTQVMLHVVVNDASSTLDAAADSAPGGNRPAPQRTPAARLEPGPVIGAATAPRLCCDAAKVLMIENAAGDPLSVGRQSRIVPWHIRKALEQRDGGCRFPGCTEKRYVDAQHIDHWVDGGETSLSNCCLLCRHHHRLVHEEGFGCENLAGEIRFYDPQGRQLGVAADLAAAISCNPADSVSAETRMQIRPQIMRDTDAGRVPYQISRMPVRDRPKRLSG